MIIEGLHYSPKCFCKNCKEIERRNNISNYMTSLQKESEWESEFESRFHTTNNDYDGGKMLWVQKEEVKSFLKEIISNREKEIAEEVKKKINSAGGLGGWKHLDDILNEIILKH
jgi:2-phosphoglycerate kinase